jgi:predicted Zn-dependent protease
MDIAAYTLWEKRPGDMTPEERRLNKNYVKFYQSPETVGAHELGHALGLSHVIDNILMHGGVRENDAATVSRQEIETIYKLSQAGNLNQDDAVLAKKGKSAD